MVGSRPASSTSTATSATIRRPAWRRNSDGNEATSPVRPEVWAEHSVWPQDPGFSPRAGQRRRDDAADPARLGQPVRRPLGGAEERAGAHGAGHEVPRRALRPEDGVRREPEAGLRLEGQHAADAHGQYRACPRRPGSRRRSTSASGTNMTTNGGDMPERDLAMDTLKGVLEGKILVHNHCYRADEMAIMIDMSKEFGYQDHGVPPRGRSLQDRRPAARQRHLRGDVGRLVRLQDGSL